MKQTPTVFCHHLVTQSQIKECVRGGFWCDQQQVKSIWKVSDLLKFLRCLFFLSAKKTTTTWIFLFSFFINSESLFDSYHGRINTIGTNKHAVSSRKVMFLSEGIYFLKHFFSCSMFGKWKTKEKLFHVRSPQSHHIARTGTEFMGGRGTCSPNNILWWQVM